MSKMKNFGYLSDNDDVFKATSEYGKFGLNQGNITELEYTPNGGKDGALGEMINFNAQVGDQKLYNSFFLANRRFWDSDNNEVFVGSEEYNNFLVEEDKLRMAIIIHAAKSLGVVEEQLSTALAKPVASFVEWFNIVRSLIRPDYAVVPIDIFLEYQWIVKKGNTKTFLQIPKNFKGGRFFSNIENPEITWEEIIEKDGSLHYIDENGARHVFERNASFMDSPKAVQQNLANTSQAVNNMSNTPTQTTPAADIWGA